jgi:hypothetical protein
MRKEGGAIEQGHREVTLLDLGFQVLQLWGI